MKTKLFGKTGALVMGSLIVFSGQALAFSSNNQKLSNGNALTNSEILITQNGELDPEDFAAISQLALEAKTTIGNVAASLNNVSESELPGKNALGTLVVNLESTIGDLALLSENEALTAGDGTAIAQTIGNLSTTVGDVAAQLSTTAQSEEGKAVAQTAVEATTTVGDIALKIENVAKTGSSDDSSDT